jgi:hypothetical protein
MPRFLAVHAAAFSEEQLKQLASRKDQLPQGITWNQAYCAPGSNRAFCEWGAPNKEAVEQVLQANSIPFVAIYEVDRFDPGLAEFDRP